MGRYMCEIVLSKFVRFGSSGQYISKVEKRKDTSGIPSASLY